MYLLHVRPEIILNRKLFLITIKQIDNSLRNYWPNAAVLKWSKSERIDAELRTCIFELVENQNVGKRNEGIKRKRH